MILREFCALHVSEKIYQYINKPMALSKNEPSVPRDLGAARHLCRGEGIRSLCFRLQLEISVVAPQQSWGELTLILPSEWLGGNQAGLGMVPLCWALTERTALLLPHLDP